MLPMGVHGCGNCDGCTQARIQAARDAVRNPKPTNTDSSCLCTSETINPACPATKADREPLAWSISPSDIQDQANSPLFTLLPFEIRDMIYTYALTDTTSYPVDRDRPEVANPFARFDRTGSIRSQGGVHLYPSDIAISLLKTCKAVYLETYATPLQINPFIVGELSRQIGKHDFSAWQLAQISGLDITLPQAALENGALRNALSEWRPDVRHEGMYVVPMGVIRGGREQLDEYGWPKTLNNDCLVPGHGSPKKGPQRLMDVLARLSLHKEAVVPCARDLRVTRAQPLTHLTLRLTHTDWFTWGKAPDDDPIRRLYLDPSFKQYQGGRLNELMRFLASERVAGRHPRLDPQCWGSHISSLLPELKTLVLVLETWKVKEEQLECVVQCAKTWRFCEGGQQEGKEKWALVWDGEVVEKRWRRGLRGLRLPKDASWADRCNDFEVRVVRYVKKRVEG